MGFFHLLPGQKPSLSPHFSHSGSTHTHINQHKKIFGFLSCEKLAQNTIFQGKITKKSHFQGFFFKIVKNSCLLPEWQRKQSVSRSTKKIHPLLMLNKTKKNPNNVQKWPKNGHFLLTLILRITMSIATIPQHESKS